ncbi:MAG: glycosyltransferase family 2 protein [Chloroflexi bacterium]|nr:glycosyltransferase family 2 protein [Chloroflexota bacterium]
MIPLLSIVIVNSDGCADTLRCLESIMAHPADLATLAARSSALAEQEIILVDNCSRDGCAALVRRSFPMVRVIESPVRQGFARNYNLGIRQARGMFVLVLNNDTMVHAGALTHLVAAMIDAPAYGIAGPRLVSCSGAVQTDCARPLPTPGAYVWTQLVADPGFPIGRLWQQWLRWRIERRSSGPVACISGSCMLVRRAAFEQAGLLDEGFDFYYEDVEWCHRFQRMGWRVGYVAEATITHLGDQSLGKVRVWARKSEYRSALRYFRLYHRLANGAVRVLRLATIVGWLLRGTAFAVAEALTGKDGHARAYGYLWSWILREEQAGGPSSVKPGGC